MTNFEKCRQEFTITDTLEDMEGEEYIDFCTTIRRVRGRKVCKASCAECYKWLGQEYKPSILDKAEKKYLFNIVRPFRNKVEGIVKLEDAIFQKEYIKILLKGESGINLPFFDKGIMYRGMRVVKPYSLKELGL